MDRKGKMKKCEVCKDEFYCYPSHYSRRFCSKKCHNESMIGSTPWNKGKKTGIPAWNKGIPNSTGGGRPVTARNKIIEDFNTAGYVVNKKDLSHYSHAHKTKLPAKCKKCKNESIQTYGNIRHKILRKRKYCRDCWVETIKLTRAQVKRDARKVNLQPLFDETPFVNVRAALLCLCLICGKKVKKTADAIRVGKGCQSCGLSRAWLDRRLPHKEIKRKGELIHLTLQGKIKRGQSYDECHDWTCNDCGHNTYRSVKEILYYASRYPDVKGVACYNCTKVQNSKGEKAVRKTMTTLFGVQAFPITKDSRFLSRNDRQLKIDAHVCLGDIEIIGEFDGHQHYFFVKQFHRTQEDFITQQERDKDKDVLAKLNGIHMIRIPFDYPCISVEEYFVSSCVALGLDRFFVV